MRIYDSFEEVEEEIRNCFPSTIYKYRSWNNPFHKKIITDKEVWFAHPFSLNDPYDVRPPYKFHIGKTNWNSAAIQLMEAGRELHPDLTEEQLREEVSNKIDQIQKDPVSYFNENRRIFIFDERFYNQIGVFSCCESCENGPMWAHYGSDHAGFSIGFKTVELAKGMKSILRYVDYNDNPIDYFPFKADDDMALMEKEIFQKSSKWSYEQEIRFLKFGIGTKNTRANNYPTNAVKEVVLGVNSSLETQNEVIKSVEQNLGSISVFKLNVNNNKYGFKKIRIG